MLRLVTLMLMLTSAISARRSSTNQTATSPVPPCDWFIVDKIFRYREEFQYGSTYNPPNTRSYNNHTTLLASPMKFIVESNMTENTKASCKTMSVRPFWKVKNGYTLRIKIDRDGKEEFETAVSKDAYLILPDYVFIFTVISRTGVYAAYKCREEEYTGASNQHIAWVAAAEYADDRDIKNAMGVMALLGFELNYEFKCSSHDLANH